MTNHIIEISSDFGADRAPKGLVCRVGDAIGRLPLAAPVGVALHLLVLILIAIEQGWW